MKEIILTQGKVALVDDEDYEWLNQWKWYAIRDRNIFYAERKIRVGPGKQKKIRMHRVILGRKNGYEIDHKDGNGLHNFRDNLRHVTIRQNQQNQHRENKSSNYPGVFWDKKLRKWRAQIKVSRVIKCLGCYIDERDAFEAYKKAVKLYTGKEVLVTK